MEVTVRESEMKIENESQFVAVRKDSNESIPLTIWECCLICNKGRQPNGVDISNAKPVSLQSAPLLRSPLPLS